MEAAFSAFAINVTSALFMAGAARLAREDLDEALGTGTVADPPFARCGRCGSGGGLVEHRHVPGLADGHALALCPTCEERLAPELARRGTAG